jgi:peroxiredoxin-like protein
MPLLHHEYPVAATWTGGRDGSGEVAIGPSSVQLKVAPEFGGPGGESNPEELLTSAVVSCYAITLGIVATNRRLPVLSTTVEAIGHVEQEGVNYTFTAILLRPTITVAADATDEQIAMAEDTAHRAERYCIITNAVRDKVKITVEPTVVREG